MWGWFEDEQARKRSHIQTQRRKNIHKRTHTISKEYVYGCHHADTHTHTQTYEVTTHVHIRTCAHIHASSGTYWKL